MNTGALRLGGAVMGAWLMILGAFAEAVGADWVSVYSRSGVNFYYDRESLAQHSSGKIALDTKTVFETDTIIQRAIKERRDKGLSVEGWNRLRYIINRIEIDCPSKKYNFLSGRHYEEGGNPLTSEETPPVRWNPIVDNSPMMSIYQAVCSAVKR